MAEAIISLLIEKLGSPLLDKFGSIYRVKKELNNLRSTFTAIQAVLKDAEEQQWTSNTIRDWLDKLEDVAYEVGDILDEFATEDLRRQVEIRNSTTKKVRDFFTPSKNPVAFKSKMSNKVREVAERLDVIAREKSNYNLRQEDDVDRRKETEVRVQTRSFVPESEALGRKEDNDKLVHLLVNRGDEVEENVSIVPIVGMGGLGKTTLAKLVYDDERVISYFDQRMWVFVSEKFDRAEIMKASIGSVNDERCDLEHMYPLQSRLRKTLSGRRYLLVLDDVWNENQEAWLQLKSLLSVGKKGSKIIVTTRSNIVANMMGTLPTHHLEGLQEEDCQSLFKQRAFPNRDEEAYPDLVRIGKEIVKKCKGVPLVAKVLGGLLHYKRSESEWLSIKNNEIWELKEDQIMPTLRLSYNHLPSQLKQCFTYCIIFHKGGRFEQQEVIQMWIAQGLIQSSEEGKLMEDFGAEYFKELCWRSFFQEEVMDYVSRYPGELAYKMHDHIYDLAKSVRRTECLTVKARRMECVPRETRHFSFASKGGILLTDLMSSFHNAEKLQTLILEGIRIEEHVTLEDISSFTCLRVLILRGINIKTLPNSIGKLKHLRYLELAWTHIETLPESICTLWNLETLKLLYCGNLRELPNNMWKMISLRHLEIRGSHRITEMPARISKLSDLQTLTLFIVGKENGIDELRKLNLRGSINIQNLQNVPNPLDADKVGLGEMQRHKLSSLGLSWKYSHDSTSAENENSERVIESLQPHSNLQSLGIKNYMGSRFPHWLMHLKVPNLVEVSLINCKRCEILPPFSQLHHLKVLTIQDMPDLEKWSSDERSQTLPHIQRLAIIDCPKLTQMPHLPFVVNLKLMRCNEMLLMSVMAYTTITALSIGGFPEMISFPEGLLKNLTLIKPLYIEDCPKLKSLSKDVHDLPAIEALELKNCGEVESLMEGVRNLTSLISFHIFNCNHLTSLPDEGFQGPTSLRYLQISNCDKLKSLGEGLQVQHLNSLAFFTVIGCPELAALPESLFNLTALKTLRLFDLPKLASLSEGIGNLASLEELDIEQCPHVLSLPASLQKVTMLQSLIIESCPSLERRCAKEKGEDWYKIAHVSVILINGQCLQERK